VAGPEDRRKQDPDEADPEDLFEDLDSFFAPIQDPDWPTAGDEGQGPAAPQPPEAGPGEDPLGDWAGPTIDLPGEHELVGPPAGPPPTPPPPEPPATEPAPGGEPLEEEGGDEWERFREAAQAEAAEAAPPVEEPVSMEDMGVPPPQYAGLPGPQEDEGLGAMFGPEEEPAPEPPPVVLPPAEGQTVDLEAAAEHFAEGMRESPEDVERELLADLEEPAGPPGTIRVEPVDEGPPPPAWQEPMDAGGQPEPAEGRNLPAAAVSGALLALAAIALLAIGKGPFAVLATLVLLTGQAELYAVMRARGSQPATALGLVVGALMLAGAYLKGEPAILFAAALGMALSVFWYVAAPVRARRGIVTNLGATLTGILYVPFLGSYALLLLRAPEAVGRNLLLVVVGLTVLYDISAYGIGSLWGSRPLAPTVSPRKSWEGVIGATFILLLFALALIPLVTPFADPAGADSGGLGAGAAVGLALVIAVAAPLGDLAESALKRDLGVKDMGTLLPGHGGILDRIDSILFAAPAAWYFMRIVLL